MIVDAYGRELASLRVSVTRKCNYRCIFCHFEGMPPGSRSELTPAEYEVIARAFRKVGITSIKFTGGEPLMRHDLEDIISAFSAQKFEDISMTTNGYGLAERAATFVDAGLMRVNVSLHSLKPETYAKITGTTPKHFYEVLRGIERAREVGLEVALNFVVLKGINESEVFDIIRYSVDNGFNLHIIELHPVGRAVNSFDKRHEGLNLVKEYLYKMADKVLTRPLHNRPRFIIGDIYIELVEPVKNPLFCAGCKRLRMSPEGLLYPCLQLNEPFVDLRSALATPNPLEELISKILEINDFRKPFHMWNLEFERKMNISRRATGGFRLRLPKRGKLQFRVAQKEVVTR